MHLRVPTGHVFVLQCLLKDMSLFVLIPILKSRRGGFVQRVSMDCCNAKRSSFKKGLNMNCALAARCGGWGKGGGCWSVAELAVGWLPHCRAANRSGALCHCHSDSPDGHDMLYFV
jgi:hypothetical protein